MFPLPKECPENEFEFHAPLGRRSTLRAGGEADCLFRPRTVDSLIAFRQWNQAQPQPYQETLLGGLSNVLIRDGGLEGVTVTLSHLEAVPQWGELAILPAGLRNVAASLQAIENGFSGFEILAGIPGTLGGAIAMNAGADGWEIGQSLAWIEVLTKDGDIRCIDRKDLPMTYRNGGLDPSWVVLNVALQLVPDSPEHIRERQLSWSQKRRQRITLPSGVGTAGSAFKNPPQGPKAWELIDSVGGRGLRRGGAIFSEVHTNYLLNDGGATAEDLELLGEEVRSRVAEAYGVMLEWEVRILGRKRAQHGERIV